MDDLIQARKRKKLSIDEKGNNVFSQRKTVERRVCQRLLKGDG